jgi:hypothetical protein
MFNGDIEGPRENMGATTCSSNQSPLIVKHSNSSAYFIISVGEAQTAGAFGVKYNTVDLSLQNGLGDIDEKNVSLFTGATSECLAATLHRNGKDIWVVMHEFLDDTFHSYLLTDSGFDPSVDVKSAEGPSLVGNGSARCAIVFNKNGDKMIMAGGWPSGVSTYSFDNSTGEIIHLSQGINSASCGLALSPNENYLYISTSFGIERLSLNWPTMGIKELVYSGFFNNGQLKYGPDNKLYCNMRDHAGLLVIENTEASNLSDVISVVGRFGTQSSGYGLPNIFVPEPDGINSMLKELKISELNFRYIGESIYWDINQVDEVKIFSLTGQIVEKQDGNRGEVSTRELKPGPYFVTFLNEGSNVTTKIIVSSSITR